MTDTAKSSPQQTRFFYDSWMEAAGIPIHRGHSIASLRTAEVGYWAERDCNACFIQLMGQEGVSEGRITEIAPGATVKSFKMAVDEVVYIIAGTGATRVWTDEGSASSGHVFEWHERALFQVPAHHHREFTNLHPTQPARLLHYNYLPVAMSVVRDPDFFFNNPYRPNIAMDDLATTYGDAKEVVQSESTRDFGRPSYWTGNFFPDMSAWDNLRDHSGRGAGGSVVNIRFAGHPMGTHMSVFAPGLYKKGHRHGPGRLIVIPGGVGYSLLWAEGQDKIVVPWEQDSVFVPPEDWYHQHFNVGTIPARYLALGPLPQFSGHLTDTALDAAKNEIAYVNEDPWVREHFEEEVAKHGGKSLMPDEAYTDPDYRFKRMKE